MAAFPLYSPLICPPGWEPTFTAGSTPCTLQSGDVTRSRLTAGGALFRSVETAATENVNNIWVSCELNQTSHNPSGNTVYDVILNYTNADGDAQTPIVVTSGQVYDNVGGSYTTNGIDTLRGALVGNSILTMPTTDIPSTWTPASDADSITSFGSPASLNLDGGAGLPANSDGIRTGPTYALFHVANADTADDGSNEEVNEISEWDGVNNEWVPHPSLQYEIDSDGNITPTPPCP